MFPLCLPPSVPPQMLMNPLALPSSKATETNPNLLYIEGEMSDSWQRELASPGQGTLSTSPLHLSICYILCLCGSSHSSFTYTVGLDEPKHPNVHLLKKRNHWGQKHQTKHQPQILGKICHGLTVLGRRTWSSGPPEKKVHGLTCLSVLGTVHKQSSIALKIQFCIFSKAVSGFVFIALKQTQTLKSDSIGF